MDQIMRDSLYRIAMAFRTEDEAIKAFETLKGKLKSSLQWREFTVMDLPPEEFVLVYVHFESESNPGAKPRILMAFYDGQYWRTHHGRLKGRVSHWMPLPDPPESERKAMIKNLVEKHVEDEILQALSRGYERFVEHNTSAPPEGEVTNA